MQKIIFFIKTLKNTESAQLWIFITFEFENSKALASYLVKDGLLVITDTLNNYNIVQLLLVVVTKCDSWYFKK